METDECCCSAEAETVETGRKDVVDTDASCSSVAAAETERKDAPWVDTDECCCSAKAETAETGRKDAPSVETDASCSSVAAAETERKDAPWVERDECCRSAKVEAGGALGSTATVGKKESS